jgi:hypothetical protein
LRRSWMNRNSSACLRVNIGAVPATWALPLRFLVAASGRSTAAETNHERTLSVPYVFRNHLI